MAGYQPNPLDPFDWLNVLKQNPKFHSPQQGAFVNQMANQYQQQRLPVLPGIGLPNAGRESSIPQKIALPPPLDAGRFVFPTYPMEGRKGDPRDGGGNGPPLPTDTRPKPNQPQPAQGNGTGKPKPNQGSSAYTTNPNPTGGVYKPTPTGATARSAFAPVVFPGVETSSASWAKYQDGSFVDYSSGAWQKAAAIQVSDPQQKQLWDALPDSWKADMGGWDPAIRDAWLKAMSNPHMEGTFKGQRMTGQQAAQQIANMANETRLNQAKATELKQPQMQYEAFQPRAYFVDR